MRKKAECIFICARRLFFLKNTGIIFNKYKKIQVKGNKKRVKSNGAIEKLA